MEAIALLESQHRLVEQLFARIKRTRTAATRRAMLTELADNLMAHALMEQEIFYPACRETARQQDTVAEAVEEHDMARYALEKLLATRATDKSLEARMTVLRDLVAHHVREEESELLPRARRALGRERLMELGARMSERFDELMALGHRAMLAGETAGRATRTRTTTRRAAAKKPRRTTTGGATPRTRRTTRRAQATRG